MKIRKLFLLFIFLFLAFQLNARQVRIGLYVNSTFSSYTFSSGKGEYGVYAGNQRVARLIQGQSLTVEQSGTKVFLIRNGIKLGTYSALNFRSLTLDGFFKLKKGDVPGDALPYRDHIEFKVINGVLRPINVVELEQYVSSVVESEIGSVSAPEFLKVQAIIARTYALGHMNRHAAAGFNLCDDVHCQAYKAKNRFNPYIKAAVEETHDLILVDKKQQMITAAYHSNCGGQTVSAKDVWSTNLEYLQPVTDIFCLAGNHTAWTRLISKQEWIQYLRERNFNFEEEQVLDSTFCFTPQGRTCCYSFSESSLPLKNIRSDFKLKSTFFDIISEGDSIRMNGRGFGHGVGLCQEGAIQMALHGYAYKEILDFYFKDVRLVNSSKKLPIRE